MNSTTVRGAAWGGAGRAVFHDDAQRLRWTQCQRQTIFGCCSNSSER